MILRGLTQAAQGEDFKTSIPNFCRRFGYAFVPQLVRTRIFKDPAPRSRIFPTSWLDGLRGLAALSVFNFHYAFAFGDQSAIGWGDSKHRWLIELPILRLPYLGLPMVNIFFIVAGYVISLKPLQLMHANTTASREKLLQTMCSSVFRRLFRLYLPVVASTLMVLIFTRLYLFEYLRSTIYNKQLLPGHREQALTRYDALGEQLLFWCHEMVRLTSVWEWRPFYALHDQHLWTIPQEFRSSLVLYLSLIMAARTRVYVRLFLLLALSAYTFCSDRWEVTLYMWGACIAQWDIMRAKKVEQPKPASSDPEKDAEDFDNLPTVLNTTHRFSMNSVQARIRLNQVIYMALFIFALFLMSQPAQNYQNTLGYQFLSNFVPPFWSRKEKFLPIVGATLLLWTLSHWSPTSLAHRILTSSLVQYLGSVSFSLYLMHGPVLHLFGYGTPIFAWQNLGLDRGNAYGWFGGILFGWVINGTVAFWAADVFGREVDGRCVRFAKWLEERCFTK
jgi:peptidoglycan/LPS O-acetylase OafA/YrhL